MKDVKAGHGEIVTAFIVIKQGYDKAKDQIIKELKEECFRNLPIRDVPLQYFVRTELPLSDVGKIDYRILAQSVNRNRDE